MPGLGTLINIAAVLLGTSVGLLLKGGLKPRFQQICMSAIGLSTFFIGISGAVTQMVYADQSGALSSRYVMLMILCLVLGGLIGEGIDIERRLDSFGDWLKTRLHMKSSGGARFVEGFVTSSLLFCVGAMAIVGSLEDGLTHNISTLSAKSVMDGVAAAIFAATLGVGVYFSSLSLLAYQGGITLLAHVIRPYLSDLVISQMSFVGSVLIFALGFNLIFGKKIKVGNLLPAMFLPILFDLLARALPFLSAFLYG